MSRLPKLGIKIVTRPLHSLRPAPYNPRVDLRPGMPEFEDIKASILAYGLVQPLVYATNRKYILGGAQRLKVIKALGYGDKTLIPTSGVSIRSLKAEKRLNMALNKIGGLWDPAKLKDMYEDGIFEGDLELPTGFSIAEIEALGQGESPIPAGLDSDPPPDEGPTVFQIIVDCKNRTDQNKKMMQLRKLGMEVRELVV